ncbi:MAG: hypothetical protein EBQ80_06350, partial [Proteobacteria bacterium]|nr:hypothetical protein [Pseudomonadota bacterium]
FQATRGQKVGQGASKPKPLIANSQAGIDYRPALQPNPTLSKLLAIVCQWPEILPEVDESLAMLHFPPGPLNELHQHILRAYTQLNLPPEKLHQNLTEGPHSATVTSLLASTGTTPNPTQNSIDATPPNQLFKQHFAQWQQQQQTHKQYTQIIKQADWFNPENWQQFKQLKES